VLRRVNVDIKEDEFVTIMGPSGAGVSTLLSILACSTAHGQTGRVHQPHGPPDEAEGSRELNRNTSGSCSRDIT
jgi:ABC-type lipoprotein export system ATPase subunit